MTSGFFFNRRQLERLYPFYICVDRNLRISSYSSQMQKLHSLSPGGSITETFEIKPSKFFDTPYEELDGRSCQLVSLAKTDKSSHILINSEVFYLSENDELIILGTPNIYFHERGTDISELEPPLESFVKSVATEKSEKAKEIPGIYKTHYEKPVQDHISGVAITDANGKIEWVSREFEITLGRTLSEVMGKRPRDVIYGKKSTYIHSSFVDEMVRKKERFSFENIGYNKAGKSFWFKTTVQPIISKEGKITGRYYHFEDITGEKMKETVYNHSYDLWKLAVSTSGDGVWALDSTSRQFVASDSFKKMLGIEVVNEFSIRQLKDLMLPEDYAALTQAYKRAKKDNGGHINLELRLRHMTLGLRYFQIKGTIRRTPISHNLIAIGTLSDISEQREKDIEIIESAVRMEAILRNINFGVLLVTPENKTVLINNYLCNLFSIEEKPENLRGTDATKLLYGFGRQFGQAETHNQRINAILEANETVLDELLPMNNGIIIERDFIPITSNGSLICQMWRYKDVTRREDLKKDLELSGARLQALMNHLRQAVLFEDSSRKVIFVNNAMIDAVNDAMRFDIRTGMPSTEQLENIRNIFHDPEEQLKRIEELVERGIKEEGEVVTMRSGRKLTRQFIPIQSGPNIQGFLWVYEDITETLDYQEQLVKQKEYYHSILDESPADIVILTRNHTFEYANKAAIKDPEMRKWVIGKTLNEYAEKRKLPAEFAEDRNQQFEHVWRTGTTSIVEDYYANANGGEKYMARILHPFSFGNGGTDVIVAYGIDITEQKKALRRAEQQERNIRNLLNFTSDGIFTCDDALNIMFCNPSFSEITETPADEIREKLNLLSWICENDKQKVRDLMSHVTSDTSEKSCIVKICSKRGREKHLTLSFILSYFDTGSRYIGKITDITERIEKEAALNAIILKERELSNSKSQFIRITSHELRTPLAIILANAELLQLSLSLPSDHATREKIPKMLGRITKEVTNMTETLNQLMMVSKIDAGKLDFKPTVCNLGDLLSEIASELFEPYNDGRKLTLSLPQKPISCKVDTKLLRHAVVNLVSNAFKYSSGVKKDPVLRLSNGADSIVIEVQDFGIGIPAADQPKLFNSFFRAGNTNVISGSGLGLTIVEYVMRLHGGRVTFESRLGKGSTFRMILTKNNQEIE